MRNVERQRVLEWASALVLALPFVVVSALEAAAQSTRIQQSEQILQPAGDTVEHDSFGTAVAISGNRMVIGLVGANRHTPASTGVPFLGAAYVYHRTDDGRQEIAQLGASDGISGGDYGAALAVLDNVVLIGADLQHPPVEGYPGGEAYLYRLNPGR